MEPLYIKPTKTSLEVKLDADKGSLSFSGRARPENSASFFSPVVDWIRNYADNPAEKTDCSFRIEYFNSSARKSIVEILNILERVNKSGKPVNIAWYYDSADENMKETGEEYRDLFNINFEFIPY